VVYRCSGQVLLLSHVCNHSCVEVERVVEVLLIRFELEVFLILQVKLLLWENHSSLSVRKLTLTLVFLWHVLRHRTDLASSRWLLAAS
jgi:hypothetical protein